MQERERKKYLKKILLLSCCIGCNMPLLAEEVTAAMDAENEQATKMGTITVTANKVEEDIQDVPQSISVLGEVILEEKGISDVGGVIQEIPNMMSSKGMHGNAVSFRGLNPSTFTNSNPVVIYIDGVPIINRYGFDASLANVERVEVLRGPQGTLYGKDAIGGVINIVTKDPENDWHGILGAEYGSYNYMQGTFNLSGGLVEDKLFMGINGKYRQDDGWIENTYPGMGSDGNDTDNLQLNGFFLYTPTDRFTARFSLALDNKSDGWLNGYALPVGQNFSDFNRDDAEDVSFDKPTYIDTDSLSQSLQLSYAFDALTFNSTTTHLNQDVEGEYDADFMSGTYYDDLVQFNYSELDAYSQELRLTSNNETGIRWVGGLFFDTENFESGPYGQQFPYYDESNTFYGNYEYNAISETDTYTYAAFGQAMVPMGERFELTLGGRYQHIDKSIDLDMYALPVGTAGAPSYSYSGEKNWDVFLPKAALSYRINDNWKAYVSYSQGYMPGGFNFFATSGTAEENSFEPEKTANYEIGIKGSLNRLRISVALFYMDIEDIHVYKSSAPGIYLTDNADSAHSQGIEIDMAYQLTDSIELSAALGLVEAEYDSYDAGGGVIFDGEDIEKTPSYTANAGISWRSPRGFYARADLRAAGETSFYDDLNKTFVEDDAYITVNAKVGYQAGLWDFYVYGKNLTDEEYIESYLSNAGFALAEFGDPLTIGAGIRYRF
ncbi:TonB-dependent receptor [Desulfobulbus rhabdoformis]|uniref:TonB-dependent receptor n=1 Tax=Desulfobulbus rhabdoformis TaxID=34032 RepID=UPI001965CDBD|nr:TonB-dependent receptor [Desulfobulbus rhabdoformis]MBM9616319.1 TonB-dependent receptor [Desulfobulbus rhabdoformis]